MNTQEHLNRVKSKCQELLAIAEKRTAGRWASAHNVVQTELFAEYIVSCDSLHTTECEDDCNAAFIASCAGAAEAGWKATIAAIDDTLNVDQALSEEVQKITTQMMITANGRMVEQIIAAWPPELLQKS